MTHTSHHDILRSFVHVQDGGRSQLLPVTDTFWQDLSRGAFPELEQGRLLSAFTFDGPWSVWECHPAGEEWVMLLSGAVQVVLDSLTGEETVQLNKPGECVLIPPGVWHTARTTTESTLLFLTPGAGTQHRPV